MLLRSSRPPST
ncbi:hypothetical protein CGCSCA5_v009771 [Colletotrichum siamense]|nr:hypothetical protein CGCSCA5_v009771 [Colletotrichum siamense]